ncbi:MAG: ATP-binding cassette domain-containing protein [Candidatus Aminicenantes bacterium]|nr:ATP-binding cassette domain-containing protein [Candidatus Aminicenantes bacterium]
MIKVENLTKYYGEICAVSDIGFQINKGEILGLLGPNGAGKTTFMRILTCYLNPSAGTIQVKDFNIQDHALEIKKMMGYLPENAPLYPDMLVYDYLHYVADIRQLDKETKLQRIDQLAATCSIREVMHQPIGELSKGYKQRVGLAQAMMGDPEILVLDEPTSGLDPNQIIEIREIIKKIGKEKTIILSTHILSEAEATCDRVVIINKGKIVADSLIEDLKQSLGKEAVIGLAFRNADFAKVKNVLAQVAGVGSVVETDSGEGILAVNVSCKTQEDIRGQIYALIKEQDWQLLEFYQQSRSLENIFRELTQEN